MAVSFVGEGQAAVPRELSMADLAALWRASTLERALGGPAPGAGSCPAPCPAPSQGPAPLRDGSARLWDTYDLHLLDVRPAEAFAARHIPDAASIPAAELRERAHELPRARGRLLIVATGAQEARHAAGALTRVGALPAFGALPPPGATPAGATSAGAAPRSAAPAAVADAADSWPGPWETGPPRRVLWEPSPAVRAWAGRLPPGRALDLGCGTGRDAVYLAAAGHDVAAVDRLPDALERAAALARQHGLAIRTLALDLRRELPPADGGFDLILMVRFLERALLAWAAAALRPGGHLILETFAGPVAAMGNGPRRDRWILAPQEALRVVESWKTAGPPIGGVSWSVLEYVEGAEMPGTTLTRMVARKGVAPGWEAGQAAEA